jgi:hypothetical protein
MEPRLKVGVKEGGGPPPGYQWSVGIIDFVFAEAIDVFRQSGYDHMALQIKELAMQDDPTHSVAVDIRPIETFYELRDKGRPFGGANVRLFFGVDKTRKAIVPLGAIKKQNNGKTPHGDVVVMRRRWRKYLAGDYGEIPV